VLIYFTIDNIAVIYLKFEMKNNSFFPEILGKYKTCLERQEAEHKSEDIVMNSRNDFHQPPMRRVVIMRENGQETQSAYPQGQSQLRVPQPRGSWLAGQNRATKGGQRGRPRGSRGTRRGAREQQDQDNLCQETAQKLP
jgi:hypothetical protein